MYFVFVYLIACCSIGNNLAQHCRDNFDKAVPWWFIYKPPADVIPPYKGQNFTFVSSGSRGQWMLSTLDFTDDNMITFTLKSPGNYNSRAIAVFHSRLNRKGRTSARGVISADKTGGFFLTHTVPGLPGSLYKLPHEELQKGHLLSCISFNHDALNEIAEALMEIAPNFTMVHIPRSVKDLLPKWRFENLPPSTVLKEPSTKYLRINEGTEPHQAIAAIVTRRPGVKSCIYLAFAKHQRVMLNVYGQSESSFVTTVCNKNYGVRYLESLCLKRKGTEINYVYYVADSEDRSWFAVSTAADWQKRGSGPKQYWVCTSLVDKEADGEGGMLTCLQNYELWVAFDNLKVAEPSCD